MINIDFNISQYQRARGLEHSGIVKSWKIMKGAGLPEVSKSILYASQISGTQEHL